MLNEGLTIARTYCMRCHSIDRVSPSPLAIAPPFRTLHKKYTVERLEQAMAQGISTGHPTMPEFRFDPRSDQRFHRISENPGTLVEGSQELRAPRKAATLQEDSRLHGSFAGAVTQCDGGKRSRQIRLPLRLCAL